MNDDDKKTMIIWLKWKLRECNVNVVKHLVVSIWEER